MERITQANCVGPLRYGHEFRYRLAAGFISEGDVILDAACGTGYGLEFLWPFRLYVGIDRIPLSETVLVQSSVVDYQAMNLVTERVSGNWYFDVFIGFETIEHLSDHRNYVDSAHQAEKWILLSTPVVPTRHTNPHHVHDFAPGDLRKLFENDEWEHYQTVQQPSELSEIVVLRRRT